MRLLTLCVSLIALAVSPALSDPAPPAIRNAYHIFNAIHSSLRQWGSSLNHNGMSFFLASVPEGTQFYHGRGDNETVTGMEWLALEPEHAMIFARVMHWRPPPVQQAGKPVVKVVSPRWIQPDSLSSTGHTSLQPEQAFLREPSDPGSEPPRRRPKDGDFFNDSAGYLHTYVTTHPLRLLYIDGLSAGKSALGTLDSQDHILLRDDATQQATSDYARAEGLCHLAEREWGGRVDGFLRMESGFEIILCEFAGNVCAERITRAATQHNRGPGRGGSSQHFKYYEAVAARYTGVGGGRARLDFDHFVSAYTFDLDLFRTGQLPRLNDVPSDVVQSMKLDVKELVMSDIRPEDASDWQAVADEIVTRYGHRLPTLVSGKFSDAEDLSSEIEGIMQPFIDYDDRNPTAEAERCTMHFIPLPISSPPSSVARTVVTHVSHRICHTLASINANLSLDHATSTSSAYVGAIESIQQLIADLAWTIWKECRPSCADDEICVIPMWPLGSQEDYDRPTCANSTTLWDRRGYWDCFGPWCRTNHSDGLAL